MELRMFLLSFAGLSIWHLPRICKACNPDQFEFSGSCYIFSQNASDFYSAQSSCENLGMHVVNIESQEEQNFLVGTIEDGDADRDYWIGLSAVTWLDGTRLTYDNFGSEGAFNDGARCFRIFSQDRWYDENCSRRKRFICEGEGACDGFDFDVVENEGSCYYFSRSRSDFITSYSSCDNVGMHLVFIGSQDEQNFVANQIKNGQYWIGLTSLDWNTNGSGLPYHNLVPDEEDAVNKGRVCFRMDPDNNFQWLDSGCYNNFLFICEKQDDQKGSEANMGSTAYSIMSIRTSPTTPTQKQDPASSTANAVIPAVITVVVLFLVIVVVGVICYKRRPLFKSANRHTEHHSAHVLNPAFTAPDVDKNDYTGLLKPGESASNKMPVSSAESQQSHQYTELPSSLQPSKEGENCIYNEVDEQDYNVLFGGKEQGDYHEYNMPETKQTARNTTYQDLLKDRISGIATSLSGNVLNGVGHKSEEDKESLTEADSNRYEDLRQGSSDYTSLIRDGKPTSPVPKHISPTVNQISQEQDKDYSELHPVVSPVNKDNRGIYNEVGEQDYNTLFGGKEHGDYHEYNLPEHAEKTPNAAYQDLLISGMQGGVSNPKPMEFHGQNKDRVRAETDNEGYQDLRKIDDNYTSLHPGSDTPSKLKQSTSVTEMDSGYQAVQTSSTEYACLEPNVDGQSSTNPKPGSVKNHEYQTLEKFPSTSDYTPDRSDDISPECAILEQADIDESTESTNERENDQEHSYESLQRGQENSGAEKGVTPDYEDPIQVIPEKPYDNFQRKQWSKPLHPHPMVENANDNGDYEDPRPAIEDSADAYQTLESLGSQGHVQTNEDSDYSHLQRNPRETTSKDFISAIDSSNPYGTLNDKS